MPEPTPIGGPDATGGATGGAPRAPGETGGATSPGGGGGSRTGGRPSGPPETGGGARPDAAGGRGGNGGSPAVDASVDVRGAGGGSADAAGGTPDQAAGVLTFENVRIYFANCVFCHHEPGKRTDLQDIGLYQRLINRPATNLTAGCTVRTLVVPGQPMMSLIYRKVSGMVPANCGTPMPPKAPRFTPQEAQLIYDWIAGGALER
jgi:hypothetical protein